MPQTAYNVGIPSASDRLFFAIFPEPLAVKRIARLAQLLRDQYDLPIRPLAKDRFHITLHFLGDYRGLPKNIVEMACEAAGRVTVSSFPVTFDLVKSFHGKLGNHPVVLRSKSELVALNGFQNILGDELKKTPLAPKVTSRFKSHVTLCYTSKKITQAIEPITWTVREFVLVQSLVGRTQYVPLAHWAFR